MKTYTTVREDGNIGPELNAVNVIEAEEKLKEISKNKQYRYRIVGEKVNLKL